MVDGVSASHGAHDIVSDYSHAKIPQLHDFVPTTGVNLVGVVGRVLGAKYLVGVALVLLLVESLNVLHGLVVVELDLSEQA